MKKEKLPCCNISCTWLFGSFTKMFPIHTQDLLAGRIIKSVSKELFTEGKQPLCFTRSPNWTAKREKKVDVLRNHNHLDSYHEYRRNIYQ